MVALVAGVAFATAGAGSAFAAPTLVIESPVSGSATNNKTPPVAGTTTDAVDPVTIKVYAGGSAEGSPVQTTTPTVPVGGKWSVALATLADGTYTVQAEQTQLLETGRSAPVTFNVKTAAPAVTLNPIASPTNNATPTLGGAAGTKEGDQSPVSVTVYKGSSVGGEVAASGSAVVSGATWSYTTSALGDGTYTAQATQKDAAGNTGQSLSRTFVVDTTPPAVTLNPIATPTSEPTPVLGGEAGTAPGDEPVVTVTIYKGSSVAGEVAASGSASLSGAAWTYSAPHLADGAYTAQATQKDAAGNVGKSAARTFTVKTAAPAVTLNPVATPTSNPTPALGGEAGTVAGDEQVVTVTIYNGGSATGQVAASGSVSLSGAAWTYTAPHLADGTYTAQAMQKDAAGNTGKSLPRTFVVDTTPPVVTLEPIASPTNNATPTLGGAAGTKEGDQPAVSVTVYKGSSVGGEVAASGSALVSGATWSYTSSHLEDGTYTAQAEQKDQAGNTGRSSPATFTVKATKPMVRLFQPASPSNNASPTFSGEADSRPGNNPAVTLRVYSGSQPSGTPLQTVTVQASGEVWSVGPIKALSDGTYTAQAEQKDQAGNTGLSSPATFTIKTAPPKISLNSVHSPTNNPTPTLEGLRDTAPGDVSTVSVTVFAGSSVGGNVVASASFTASGAAWSYTTPHLADGTYTAEATQKDEAGNVGSSSPVTFTVDTIAPEVTLNPVASPSGNSTPTLGGSAGTAPGDRSVAVTIYEGASAAGKVAASGTGQRNGGSWSYTPPSKLPDGTYTAIAVQEDEAGNVGKSSAQTFTINTAPPTVTLNSPAPLSNNTKPSFSGSASDTTAVTVAVYPGAKPSGTPVWKTSATVVGGSWSAESVNPPLTNGQYTAIAVQPSSLGNPEGKSAPATFTVNTAAPTVTLAQPTSPSNNVKPSFTGTASDVNPVTVNVYEGEHVVAKATATPGGEAWTSTAAEPALPPGKHTYTAIASQKSSIAGNPEGTSAPVTFTVDTTEPAVTLTQPKSPSNNPSPTFSGTATDASSVTVNIYKGVAAKGSVVTTATAPAGGAWTSGTTAKPLADGTYTAQATQPSSLGNLPGTSAAVTFVIDTKKPAVTITQLHQINTPTPELAGHVGTESGDLPSVTVKLYEGELLTGKVVAEATITVGAKTSWSFKSSNLADGTYTAQVTQADEAGNIGASTTTFTIDTVAPTVTLNAPPTPTNNQTPSFTGTSTDPTTVTVEIYEGTVAKGAPVTTATATGAVGEWKSAPAAKLLASHLYTAIATQADAAGNVGTSSPVHFIVDTQAPTVTLDQPRSPYNDRSPSFSGSASDRAPVAITVYQGSGVTGREVAWAKVSGTGGRWSSSPLTLAADGTYTAQARQESLAGNHEGVSAPVTFTVDTVAPHLTLSYIGRSGETQAIGGSSEGDEDDLPSVTVQVFSGGAIGEGQAPVQSIVVGVAGGQWSARFAALPRGLYAARALQSDQAGNVGLSNTATFQVAGSAAIAAGAAGPAASFSWYPPVPHVGERVSLVSGSTDPTSPLTAFAWDLAGKGSFQAGGQQQATSFATPGNHVVRLRVTDATGASSVASQTIPVSSQQSALMRPFPLVRIVTLRGSSGIRLRVLSILAAPGARITITCKGHGCPVRKQSKVASTGKVGLASVSFQRFERVLPTGTTLEIRVFKAGEVGKFTSLAIRRTGLKRLDTCLGADGIKPMSCPPS
jgi:hypothetical protein